MDAVIETDIDAAVEFQKMSKAQKLAALLLILEPESSAIILKQLTEIELESVTAEMAKMTSISHGVKLEVLREFSPVAMEAVTTISIASDRVKTLLEKSVGCIRAADVIGRVCPPQNTPVAAMEPIAEMEARQLYSLLRHEQLQIIALVVSYLPAEKASQLLALLSADQRDHVVERLATLSPISMEVVESVATELMQRVTNNRARAMSQTGGLKVAAELLNALPKNISEAVLTSLRERNSELGEAVMKKMFTFEELGRLDSKTLQKIMQEVDMRTLTVSLKTATDPLKNSLLSVISKRAAENVREEIAFLGPLKAAEIEGAQSQIIDTVRRLESEGEIDLEELRKKRS